MSIELVRKLNSATNGGEFDFANANQVLPFRDATGNWTIGSSTSSSLSHTIQSGALTTLTIKSVNASGNDANFIVDSATTGSAASQFQWATGGAIKWTFSSGGSYTSGGNIAAGDMAFRSSTTGHVGAISQAGVWSLGPTTISPAFHQLNGGLNIGGSTTTLMSGINNSGSVSNDTTYVPYIFVNSVVNSGASPRFQYSANKAGAAIHGWGTDSSGQMYFGRGTANTGLIDTTTYAVSSQAGVWTWGPTNSTGTHTANGSLQATKFLLGTEVVDNSITGTQTLNAYVVTGSIMNINNTATITLNGVVAQPAGTLVWFINNTGSSLVINHGNAGAAAANQISTNNAVSKTITNTAAFMMFYAGSRWKLISPA